MSSSTKRSRSFDTSTWHQGTRGQLSSVHTERAQITNMRLYPDGSLGPRPRWKRYGQDASGGATTYGGDASGYANGLWYDLTRKATGWQWGDDPAKNPANGGGPGPGY